MDLVRELEAFAPLANPERTVLELQIRALSEVSFKWRGERGRGIAMTARGRFRDLIATASVVSVATSAFVVSTVMAAGADIELGRYLAAECMTCHRAAAAASAIPNIFGLDQTHIVVVMKAYREKALPNPVMQNIAGRLKDEEINSLALFFATMKKP